MARVALVALLMVALGVDAGWPASGKRWVSRKIAVSADAVSEAPEGRSDANWVVRNVVDGRWSEPPFYPNQAWMARHIGEPGFDIWCRLDLGRDHRVHRIRLQNSQLPSFVHLRDLLFEFSDGSRERPTMARSNEIQDFHFPVHATSAVTVHLLSHYGDGFSIDKDSGGFSEVEVYEVAEEDAAVRRDQPFSLGPEGHATTWLVLGAPHEPWPPDQPPVDGEVRLSGSDARSWGITCARETAPSFGKGDLLYARVENRGQRPARLYVRGARLLGPAGRSPIALRPGVNDVFLLAQGGPVLARCVAPGGAPPRDCRVLLSHTRGPRWEQEALAALCRPRLGEPIIKPGALIRYRLTEQPVGYPLPGGTLRMRLQVLPATGAPQGQGSGAQRAPRPALARTGKGMAASIAGLGGEIRAPQREGRYRLQCRIEGTPLSWSSPLVVHHNGSPPMGLTDLDGDGRPEVLRAVWHGKDCIWISDDRSMTRRDVMGRFHGSYCVLVDVDGDGIHDGPHDFVYQAVDLNHDGVPDYEIYNASEVEKLVFSFQPNKPAETEGYYKLSFLDWDHFCYANEQEYTGWAWYRMGVHGNGCFHNTRRAWGDTTGASDASPRLAWENPIAWYDFNDDGYSDMVVRCADFTPPRGVLQEFETAFDVDRDSGPGRECTYNLQITRTAYKRGALPYLQYRDSFAPLAGRRSASYLFVDNPDWRANQEKRWIPYFDAYRLGTDCEGWEACWLLFDEDLEDKRWEEMFSVHEKDWEPFADHLGDRWEMDADYSGKGQLYLGRFDGKLHLFGAEAGEWTVDYYGLYHGSVDRRATAEGPLPPPGLKHNKVRYRDTDGNGFLDRIEYCVSTAPNWETGDHSLERDTVVRTVSLLDYAAPDDPHPDACPLISTRSQDPITGRKVSDWKGEKVRVRCDVYDRLTGIFAETTRSSWDDALRLYRAADAAGLTRSRSLPGIATGATPELALGDRRKLTDVTIGPGYAGLLAPGPLRERYRNAYWLKEKVLADLLAAHPERASEWGHLYYTGRLAQLVEVLGQVRPRAGR